LPGNRFPSRTFARSFAHTISLFSGLPQPISGYSASPFWILCSSITPSIADISLVPTRKTRWHYRAAWHSSERLLHWQQHLFRAFPVSGPADRSGFFRSPIPNQRILVGDILHLEVCQASGTSGENDLPFLIFFACSPRPSLATSRRVSAGEPTYATAPPRYGDMKASIRGFAGRYSAPESRQTLVSYAPPSCKWIHQKKQIKNGSHTGMTSLAVHKLRSPPGPGRNLLAVKGQIRLQALQ
jgi:hypothetical protein